MGKYSLMKRKTCADETTFSPGSLVVGRKKFPTFVGKSKLATMKFLAGFIVGAVGMLLLYAAFGVDISDLGKHPASGEVRVDTVYVTKKQVTAGIQTLPPASGQVEKEVRQVAALVRQVKGEVQHLTDLVEQMGKEAPASKPATVRSEPVRTEPVEVSTLSNKPPRNARTIEVKGRKGYVTLYIGMPKDDVEQLLGKPDAVSVTPIGDEVREDWTYKLNRHHDMPQSYITFKDGKLSGVTQL